MKPLLIILITLLIAINANFASTDNNAREELEKVESEANSEASGTIDCEAESKAQSKDRCPWCSDEGRASARASCEERKVHEEASLLRMKIYKGKLIERIVYDATEEGIPQNISLVCKDVKDCPSSYNSSDFDKNENFNFLGYYKQIPLKSPNINRQELKCDLSKIKDNIGTLECLIANLHKIDITKCAIKDCEGNGSFDYPLWGDKYEKIDNIKLFSKEIYEVDNVKYTIVYVLAPYTVFDELEAGGEPEGILLKDVDPAGYYQFVNYIGSFEFGWGYHQDP